MQGSHISGNLREMFVPGLETKHLKNAEITGISGILLVMVDFSDEHVKTMVFMGVFIYRFCYMDLPGFRVVKKRKKSI